MKINIQNNEFKILMFCLAAIVAIVSVLPEMVYADDVEQSEQYLVQDGYSGQYAGRDDNPHITGYYKGKLTLEESQKHIAFYITKKDGNNLSLGVEYDTKYINWNNDFYWQAVSSEWSSSLNSCLMTNQFNGKLKYYIFNTSAEAQAYIKSGDSTGAVNFDDVVPATIDKDMPYYDKFSISFDSSESALKYQLWEFNGDITGKTSVSMSDSQQIKLQEQGNVYYRYIDFCVYLKEYKKLPDADLNDQKNLRTDENKRLIVRSVETDTAWGSSAAESFSVFASDSDTTTPEVRLIESKGADNKSYLNASEDLDFTFSDSHVIDRDVVLQTRYKLVGHVVAVQCYKIVDGKYVYGQMTYGYGWRKGYGANIGDGGYVIDPDSPDPPTPVDPTDPTPTDPVNPDDWDLITYVKNLYSQLTSYFTLTKHELSVVPAVIWGLITTALAVNLAIIVFKAIRGM